MTEIIKVEPITNIFSITWELTSHCNYSCSYCPPALHDKNANFHSLDLLKESWTNIYEQAAPLNLPIKITFTGGEISTMKHFLPFVIWLRTNFDNIDSILLISNGSASTKFYVKISEYVESITFSTHSEFINKDKFFDTAIALNQIMVRPKKSFHVNIMDEPWNQKEIEKYKEILKNHNVSYSVNKINYNGLGNSALPITERNNTINLDNHPNYNCKVTLDSGEEFLLHANTLHNERFDFWQGWTCDAGHTRVHIDTNLNVYGGVCRNDLLGTTLTFQLLPTTTCKRVQCTGCTDDLIIGKHK